ncbi:hypothetical protein DMP06_03530 [Slackia equolifaciens]|uniref:Uncharacterized protein n=1 Tax=Slackia equolifaciens TaxID=498718 RepID=A0A3N0B3B4_9ACTN|nr:hypothetical protein DMP06_03530 [Slackia equolifaciens]
MRIALKVRHAINAPSAQCEPRLQILVSPVQDPVRLRADGAFLRLNMKKLCARSLTMLFQEISLD